MAEFARRVVAFASVAPVVVYSAAEALSIALIPSSEPLFLSLRRTPNTLRRSAAHCGRAVRCGAFYSLSLCAVFWVCLCANTAALLLLRVAVAPVTTVARPLHFDFASRPPVSTVRFSNAGRMLLTSQYSYALVFDVELYDSALNRDAGMHSVRTRVFSHNSTEIASSVVMFSVPYYSRTIRLLRSALWSLPLTLGLSCESERMRLALLDSFRESWEAPVVSIALELSSSSVHFRQPPLLAFEANLHGISFLLHSWFWTTTLVISVPLLSFEMLLAAFFLYQWKERRDGAGAGAAGATALGSDTRSQRSGRSIASDQASVVSSSGHSVFANAAPQVADALPAQFAGADDTAAVLAAQRDADASLVDAPVTPAAAAVVQRDASPLLRHRAKQAAAHSST